MSKPDTETAPLSKFGEIEEIKNTGRASRQKGNVILQDLVPKDNIAAKRLAHEEAGWPD